LVVSLEAAPCETAIEVTVAAEELEAIITELLLLLPVVTPLFPEIARSSSSLLFPGPEFLEPGSELLEPEPELSDVANATISKVFGTQDNERIISAVDGSHNIVLLLLFFLFSPLILLLIAHPQQSALRT
jgi:hypothetical protein